MRFVTIALAAMLVSTSAEAVLMVKCSGPPPSAGCQLTFTSDYAPCDGIGPVTITLSVGGCADWGAAAAALNAANCCDGTYGCVGFGNGGACIIPANDRVPLNFAVSGCGGQCTIVTSC